MIVVETVEETRRRLDEARADGSTVGFVPTMGYLHDGHMSLVEASVAGNDVTVASIFVNPLQFGAGEDLDAYPRDFDRDCEMCAAQGVDIVFAPSVEEMYPGPTLTEVAVRQLTDTMEGAARPTHFSGVATVVMKLFNIAGPCRAYFGEKDWQQLVVVRRMAADLSVPVEVIGCPIVRESDGLAMSSRNVYLDAQQRKAATALSQSLRAGAGAIDEGETDPAAVEATIRRVLGSAPLVEEPDYVAVVNAETLDPLAVLEGHVRLLVAARVGRARLLDNVGVWV